MTIPKPLMEALTPRERTFALHYLTSLNGAESARVAGFSEKNARTQATRLLARARVKAAVDAGLDARLVVKGDDLDSLLEEARSMTTEARRNRQYNAAARFLELRAKLKGHLREQNPQAAAGVVINWGQSGGQGAMEGAKSPEIVDAEE